MEQAWLLDVGNCDPDHGMIRRMLTEHFDVRIDRVMFVDEALEKMRERVYSLVLFNRLIFDDGSEGIELLRRAKADPSLRATPIMMISNYADAQKKSVSEGGELGFGKQDVGTDKAVSTLARYLPLKGP
jgi:CheY-like chemotaxis protein